MDDGDIPAYGYVEIVADARKYSACESASFRDPVMSIDTRPAGDGTGELGDAGNDADPVYTEANSMIGAWTIVQDVGMGFFGTEVPTTTITKRGLAAFEADDDTAVPAMDPVIACYGGNDAPSAADTPGTIGNRTGDFMMAQMWPYP